MTLLPSSAKRFLVDYLGDTLPTRVKRFIFVAVLSAKVQRVKDFDISTLRKINDVLDVCNSEKAMKLPVHLNQVIWNGELVCDMHRLMSLDGKEEQEPLVQYFTRLAMDSMPKWLRYGRAGDTQKDLEIFFRNSKSIFGHA